MVNILDTIKKRYSVRTYNGQPAEKEKIKALQDYLDDNDQGPFGSRVRFKLIDLSEGNAEELNKLVSYGSIKGARMFIAGTAEKNRAMAMEDYGFCMEKNILFATSLGLGTVWLGGSFNRNSFAKKIAVSDSEVIPAVSPVGCASENRSVQDILLRTFSGGKRRKPFEEIFFSGIPSSPLEKNSCGKYGDVLEAVRWAPSASNKQPWRIIKENEKNVFHFYMYESPIYNSAIKDVKIQNIDIGIAMCHFELAAGELGLKGSWSADKPSIKAGKLVYIATWNG